jgi:hypothetical protein
VLGLVSGQREVKVEMDVVHIRGEIYKHEVEKWQWKGGNEGGKSLCNLPWTYMRSVYSTKKETFGAYWKMETDGGKNTLWASERHECLILK